MWVGVSRKGSEKQNGSCNEAPLLFDVIATIEIRNPKKKLVASRLSQIGPVQQNIKQLVVACWF